MLMFICGVLTGLAIAAIAVFFVLHSEHRPKHI